MDLRNHIRDVHDFPKPGILFRDITPLLRDGPALSASIDQLAERCTGLSIDAIVGIESRGFLFATALAVRLGIGLIPIRKPGKLPHDTVSVSYDLEYGSDQLEMHRDAFEPGERILLVDDLLATGGTMEAACRLVREQGGEVLSTLFLVELSFLEGRARLAPTMVDSLIAY